MAIVAITTEILTSTTCVVRTVHSTPGGALRSARARCRRCGHLDVHCVALPLADSPYPDEVIDPRPGETLEVERTATGMIAHRPLSRRTEVV